LEAESMTWSLNQHNLSLWISWIITNNVLGKVSFNLYLQLFKRMHVIDVWNHFSTFIIFVEFLYVKRYQEKCV
jgi:hypothetical protein